jgi:mannose-6-phosphate isomerase-like protein (cupin superfamily)
MRIIAAATLTMLLALSIWAQQPSRSSAPSGPPQAKIVTAAELAAIIANQPADKNANQAFLELAPYRVNMEHRLMGQAASVHEREAELFYVLDGAGTVVTGGKLVDEKRTNEANLTGTAIQGGVSKRVAKGDFVLVPEGVPHQFPNVEGVLTLMSLHLPRPTATN